MSMIRRLPQRTARFRSTIRPRSPRSHGGEHKALSELLLPRYPSEGFPVVDPLPLPFFALKPLRIDRLYFEFVEMIR